MAWDSPIYYDFGYPEFGRHRFLFRDARFLKENYPPGQAADFQLPSLFLKAPVFKARRTKRGRFEVEVPGATGRGGTWANHHANRMVPDDENPTWAADPFHFVPIYALIKGFHHDRALYGLVVERIDLAGGGGQTAYRRLGIGSVVPEIVLVAGIHEDCHRLMFDSPIREILLV